MMEGPETHDFLSWYLYWCRPGTAPHAFHKWAGLSLLSAAVQDRVQVYRDAVRTGPLSLYVMLVGESGSGKGEAITRRAVEAIERCRPEVNAVIGKVSSAFLLSYLSGTYAKDYRKKGFIPRKWGNCWLIAEELAADLRTGEAAQVALADLTSMWGKSIHIDGTRGHGIKHATNLCLSVLVGTTETWLPTVFPPTSVESGTLARFLPIMAPPNPIPAATVDFPDDYDALDRYIKDWVLAYTHIGEDAPLKLRLDPDAEAMRDAAVVEMAASYPEDYFRPFVQRAAEFIGKFAALVTVSGWPLTYHETASGYTPTIDVPEDLGISVYAAHRAVTLYKEAMRALPRVIRIVKATPWSRETDQVLSLLSRFPEQSVSKARLVKDARTLYGITGVGVEKALRSLLNSEEIACSVHPYLPTTARCSFWALPEDDDV